MKPDAVTNLRESRGCWNPGKGVQQVPIPSEPEIPKDLGLSSVSRVCCVSA